MEREEAIKCIRDFMGQLTEGCQEALKSAIPELAESEDERIRRKMLEHFRSKTKETWCNIPVKDIIAYLEKQKDLTTENIYKHSRERMSFWNGKQKEQKPWKVGANAYFTPEQKPADLSEMMVHKEPYIAPVPTPMVADGQKLSATINGKTIPPENYSVNIPLAEWSEEDKRMLERAIHIIVEYSDIDEKESEIVQNWLKSLRPCLSDEEIKKIRSEEYTKGFNDAAFGGKLKEWSVEDEDRIRQIERIAQQAGCTQKLQEEIHDWLKSLRKQAKQEWSEEDEFSKIWNLVYKAIRKVLANFSVYSEDEELLDSREESIDYYSQRCAEEILKSLRPSWKPSEEQMEALQNAVALTACDKELARLYNQLEKL